MLDYGSLIDQAQLLVSLFWVHLERQHPGIESLALTDEMTQAWKQRIRVLPDGEARRGVHTVLFVVRSFYLDLIQWSLEDPAPVVLVGGRAEARPIGSGDPRPACRDFR